MSTENEKAIQTLETLCLSLGVSDTESTVHDALKLSEDMKVHPSLRSLAIDLMLVAEGDANGEFKTGTELLVALREIKKNSLTK